MMGMADARLVEAARAMREPKKWSRELARHVIESICGPTDDSQDIELYDGTLGVTKDFVTHHERQVGQIQWNDNLQQKYPAHPGNVQGVRWCSGMLISEDLFLAAGHCFDEEQPFSGWKYPADSNNNRISSVEIAKNMHVNFNYQFDQQGTIRDEDRYPVVGLVEHRLGNLDYGIVRLDGKPGKKWGVGELAKADAKLQEVICIIGHPAGVPKRLEAGHATDFQDVRIGYNDLDTLGGNSGSAILGASGLIIGVHTNGGCDDPAVGHNYGQRISSLLAVSATLRGLT
jgi:V8-like Glu-specific endopeptidase